MAVPDLRARYRGSLLGLAAGDALGTTVEFAPRGTFQPIEDMVGGGPFGLEPGQWTDDTSLALCLADSLLRRNGHDPVDQLRTYVRWYRDGYLSSTGRCFDIGTTTRIALERFERTGEPYPGPTDERSAGNGSIMRLAPVPMFYRSDPVMAVEIAAESSRTTHGAPAAVDGCRYFSLLLVRALSGARKDDLFRNDDSGAFAGRPLVPEVARVAATRPRELSEDAIRGTGYVVQSLEAALWAFDTTDDFSAGALLAVNLGDDADTTGAVYGQLAGALYGEQAIPEAWRARLTMRRLIEETADRLLDASERRPSEAPDATHS